MSLYVWHIPQACASPAPQGQMLRPSTLFHLIDYDCIQKLCNYNSYFLLLSPCTYSLISIFTAIHLCKLYPLCYLVALQNPGVRVHLGGE